MGASGVRSEIISKLGNEFLVDLEVVSLERSPGRSDQKIEQLFEQLRDPVYRYLVAAFGCPVEAEDITQEAFLRLYRCLDKGEPVENVRPWIFRVAHNLALNEQKSRKYVSNLDSPAWDHLCRTHHDPGPDPEQSVLDEEKFKRLRSALSKLSTQQRQCLLLRAEGFRYREITEVLGISTSTVAEFLRRAIGKLIEEKL